MSATLKLVNDTFTTYIYSQAISVSKCMRFKLLPRLCETPNSNCRGANHHVLFENGRRIIKLLSWYDYRTWIGSRV